MLASALVLALWLVFYFYVYLLQHCCLGNRNDVESIINLLHKTLEIGSVKCLCFQFFDLYTFGVISTSSISGFFYIK